MRPLVLHASALNDEEYSFYTSSLADLAIQSDDTSNQLHDDAHFLGMSVGIRETRAWLRGRFSNMPASTVDSILKLFHPNLNQTDTLSGGQFFAALRLVCHVQSGKQLDRALAFVQAHPLSQSPPPSRPVSPSKWSVPSHPPPLHPDTPIRRLNHAQIQAHSPIPPSSDTPIQRTNPFSPTTPQRATSSANNPFVAQKLGHARDLSISDVPPLPPRKPPPIPHTPPPRHAALTPSIKTSLSAPAHPSPPILPQKPVHVTSNLMRQSLQASKVAQSIKRAEEELERERVLSVLKRSRAGSASSLARPGKFPVVGEETVHETYADSQSNGPPLPRRRPHQVPSPPLSSSTASLSTGSSTEYVNTTWDEVNEKRPFPTSAPRPLNAPFTPKPHFASRPLPVPGQTRHVPSPERTHKPDSSLPTDLPSHVPPPPTHPTRKHLTAHSSSTDSFDMIYPDPAQPHPDHSNPPPPTTTDPNTPPNPRMSRSKSLHHPSPPLPLPPRRKRPESVQLTPTSPSDTTTTSRTPSRTLSLSLSHPSDVSSPPLTNIQRTLAKLDSLQLQPRLALASSLEALQPTLDRARYKAEAGLSWRGYLHHHGLVGKRTAGEEEEEGEAGLMVDEEEDGGASADGLSASGSENESDHEEGGDPNLNDRERERERDELKWPAGEGWHQL